MMVNPDIDNRSRRLSFLFPHKRQSTALERDTGKAREDQHYAAGGGVLDIRSPSPGAHEKHDDSDDSDRHYAP